MADIVISEFMDEAVIAERLAGHNVLYDPALVDDPARLQNALGDARALIVRNRTKVTLALLAAAPALRAVGRLGVGLDNIDLDACAARRIKVLPATGANDLSVAEYVITAALLLVRRSFFATASVAAGEWPRGRLIGGEISGRRLGLVGYGAIARETAVRARALGMSIAAHDPYLDAASPHWRGVASEGLDDLLAGADIVSIHTPLTADTRRLIDAKALARMKPTAILINAARGGIVDEAALAGALHARRLGGAALDVFEEEPLSAAGGAKFRGLENVLLTPHIAGVTDDSNTRVSRVTIENVLEVLASPPA